jgi:hypothetical protein
VETGKLVACKASDIGHKCIGLKNAKGVLHCVLLPFFELDRECYYFDSLFSAFIAVLTTNNFSNLVGTPACADDIVIVVTAGYCKIL